MSDLSMLRTLAPTRENDLEGAPHCSMLPPSVADILRELWKQGASREGRPTEFGKPDHYTLEILNRLARQFIGRTTDADPLFRAAVDAVVRTLTTCQFGQQSVALRCGSILKRASGKDSVREALATLGYKETAEKIVSIRKMEAIHDVEGRLVAVTGRIEEGRTWGNFGGGERRRLR